MDSCHGNLGMIRYFCISVFLIVATKFVHDQVIVKMMMRMMRKMVVLTMLMIKMKKTVITYIVATKFGHDQVFLSSSR